ncbi:hypothetical protein [Embleya sp. NPDC020630]|uniref:hypothetical protein n=1 Tax=Embleya sp. NPDC020630 TaxID=3363979 RepID=UPI0037A471F7
MSEWGIALLAAGSALAGGLITGWTYLRFLEVAESVILTRRTNSGGHDDLPALQRAFGAIQLEGPAEVSDAARAFVTELRRNGPLDDLEQLRVALLSAAQAALVRR